MNRFCIKICLFAAVFCIFLAGCAKKETTSPKPRGYFRIEMPEHSYRKLDTAGLPFTFDCPTIANCEIHSQGDTITWLLVNYPREHARLEISCQKLYNNMYELAVQDRDFVEMHYVKADNVSQQEFHNEEAHVFGLYTEFEGSEVACPLHFWMSDSTANFVRGTLYFNFAPNNDSVQPVIDFIREDAQKMIETLNWK